MTCVLIVQHWPHTMIKKEHCCFFLICHSVIAGHPSLWLCEKAWTPLFLLTFSITVHDSEDPLCISKLKSLLAKPPHTTNHLWHPPLCCVLLVLDLMWLCRRVRHNGILLIKAAQHEHVMLGHDPVPAQPICISRRCPEGCIAECFHLLAQERPDQGNQFGFVTAIYALSWAIICVQSYKTTTFLFQLIPTMERG